MLLFNNKFSYANEWHEIIWNTTWMLHCGLIWFVVFSCVCVEKNDWSWHQQCIVLHNSNTNMCTFWHSKTIVELCSRYEATAKRPNNGKCRKTKKHNVNIWISGKANNEIHGLCKTFSQNWWESKPNEASKSLHWFVFVVTLSVSFWSKMCCNFSAEQNIMTRNYVGIFYLELNDFAVVLD